jgi:hypothetical protein
MAFGHPWLRGTGRARRRAANTSHRASFAAPPPLPPPMGVPRLMGCVAIPCTSGPPVTMIVPAPVAGLIVSRLPC